MKRLLSLALALMLALTAFAAAEDAFPAPLTGAAAASGELHTIDDDTSAMYAALMICDLSLAGQYEAYDLVFRCAFERGTLWLVQKGEQIGLMAVDESREALLLFDPASGQMTCRLHDGGAGIEAAEQTARDGLARGEYDSLLPVNPFLALRAMMHVLEVLVQKAGLTQ